VATLMFIDGVLRNPITNAPIPQGMSLYRILKDRGRVLLLCSHKEKDDRWLRENKVNLVDDLVGLEMTAGVEWPELRQVEYCRGQQSGVELVITADPALAAKLLEIGITSLMFLHPVYMAEKFRPDGRQGAKSWEKIKSEIISQQETFVEDHRIQ